MTNSITYSILQYKHSLALGESINLGVLFYIPEDKIFKFVSGNSNRLKLLYPDLDSSSVSIYIRLIENRVKNLNSDLLKFFENKQLSEFINSHILTKDATSLQFSDSEVFSIKNSVEYNLIIENISNLLLPGKIEKENKISRHNETYILKKYFHLVIDKNKQLESKFKKNTIIKTDNIVVKFDLAWQNGSLNLIKPLSFDLSTPQHIQEKAVTYLGYLYGLNEYAKAHNCRFDFLISKPQDQGLYKYYNKAVKILEQSRTNKSILPEDKWEEYSEDTIKQLELPHH